MRYIDPIIQTLILVSCVVLGINKDMISISATIWWGLMPLLAWQFVRWLLVIMKTRLPRRDKIFACLIFLIVLSFVEYEQLIGPGLNYYFILPSAGIAVYYYVTTWCLLIDNGKQKGRFLPRLSF